VDQYIQHEQCPLSPSGRLVDAAVDAFGKHSFGEVSIDALCARAGIAKGTFYRQFANKEALFLAATRRVVERAITGFGQDLVDVPATSADPVARFAQHLRPALPMLFELGKRSVGEEGPMVAEATTLFVDLVERLGRLVRGTGDQDAAQAGGVLVIMSLVEIFTRLVAPSDRRPPTGHSEVL
jgi:AcrR family transcriptional regulator